MAQYALPAAALLVAALLPLSGRAADGAWEQYDDRDGVVSYRRAMEDSKLLATRGVATLDRPIEKLLGVYLDASRATSWVNLLIHLDEEKIAGGHDAVEHHIYDMPWPVADRQFVFRRTVTKDEQAQRITVTYHSVEDERFPITDDYVRAQDHGSYFTFTAQPDGTTIVEAVAMIDPKGALPAWLFNSVQRAWPRESIQALAVEAAKPDVRPFKPVAAWGKPTPPPAPPVEEVPPAAPEVTEPAPTEADAPSEAPAAE